MKNISITIDIQYCLLAFKSDIASAQTFCLCNREAAWEGREGGENGVYDGEKDILGLIFEVLQGGGFYLPWSRQLEVRAQGELSSGPGRWVPG